MCTAKALDDRMHMLVKQGRAPFVGSARGHEGIQVASTAAFDGPHDWLVPHYRGLGNAVGRGLTAREWMLAVFAKAGDPLTGGRNIPGGCFGSARLRIAPVSQVVAAWIPKAAGLAYAAKLRGDGGAVLCTFGDGATSKGDFHEALNFASIHKLPVVFVCENNGYAISVPLRLQSGNVNLAAKAAGYGMPGVVVDGTDVPACFAACREAAARARAGAGPTLIEARIWRINAHTSEDNQSKTRAPRTCLRTCSPERQPVPRHRRGQDEDQGGRVSPGRHPAARLHVVGEVQQADACRRWRTPGPRRQRLEAGRARPGR